MNPFSLENETALITGGGTGIGLGIARCMIAAGARVVLVGRREGELSKACAGLGPKASYAAQDITCFEEMPTLVRRAEESSGSPVSILVNNAGIHVKKPAVETTTADFQSVLNTHLLAAHALTRAVIPGMISRGHGSILFTSSMAAYMGVPQVIAYSAAKSAFFGMVSTLSAELAAQGIRVNAIAPGWIMTERQIEKWLTPEGEAELMNRQCLKRRLVPDELARFTLFLASDEASACTNQHYVVDGGWV